MRCENCTLLCVKWPLNPAKREGYLKAFHFGKRSLLRDPCLVLIVLTYIDIVLMVWLKSPQSQLSKTFLGLKID